MNPALPPKSSAVVVIALFVFSVFFAYPALPIGQSTGLQIAQALAIIALPVLVFRLPRRHVIAFLLLTVPLAVSGTINLIAGRAIRDDLILKLTFLYILVMIVLIPSGAAIRSGRISTIAKAVAAAIVVHAMIGVYQMYGFSQGFFPLDFLHLQNPSFATSPGHFENYALNTRRVMGLFPEPSAMASAIGPWALVLMALLVNSRMVPRPMKGKFLLGSAVIGAVVMIVSSGSGYLVIFVICMLWIIAPAMVPFVLGFRARVSFFRLAIAIIVFFAFAWFVYGEQFSGRFTTENYSWQLRASSLVEGTSIMLTHDPLTLLFGIGPGQTTLWFNNSEIWSVVVRYFTETGLIGTASFGLLLILVVRAILRANTQARWAGIGCLIAWLGAVVTTTAHLVVLPPWLMLSLLVVWDRMFPPDESAVPQIERTDDDSVPAKGTLPMKVIPKV